jgi:hypothetical protein
MRFMKPHHRHTNNDIPAELQFVRVGALSTYIALFVCHWNVTAGPWSSDGATTVDGRNLI